MISGAVLLLSGALFYVGARIFPGGVPGDISVQRGNTSFHFPIVSSIILSIVGTIVLNIVLRLINR